MNIYGECENQFSEVKELFNELHSTDREIGSSFAAVSYTHLKLPTSQYV